MKKLLKYLLSFTLLCTFSLSAFCAIKENVINFEEESVPVLRETLRTVGVDIDDNTSSATTNTTNITTNTTNITTNATNIANTGIDAWVVFDGTSAHPITKDDGFNISGTITKTGTGDYTISWDTDFANTNYCVTLGLGNTDSKFITITTKAVGTLRIKVTDAGGTVSDQASINILAIGAQ